MQPSARVVSGLRRASATAFLLFGLAAGGPAAAQLRGEWLGSYAGAVTWRGELSLGAAPAALAEHETAPIPFGLTVRRGPAGPELVLRIDGGPMTTAAAGEVLRFAAAPDPAADFAGGGPGGPREARLAPGGAVGEAEAGSLRLYPDPQSRGASDMLLIEGVYRQGDDSLSRRQLGVRFVDGGAEVLLWVFDRTGYRGRAWRGELRRAAGGG